MAARPRHLDTGILVLSHSVIGLGVHQQERFWQYSVHGPDEPHPFPIRSDEFGFAKFAGLGSTLVNLLLLATSNDASLRRLGTQRWERLQRSNYLALGLMTLHAVAYQLLRHRVLPVLIVFAGATVIGRQSTQFVVAPLYVGQLAWTYYVERMQMGAAGMLPTLGVRLVGLERLRVHGAALVRGART